MFTPPPFGEAMSNSGVENSALALFTIPGAVIRGYSCSTPIRVVALSTRKPDV